MLKRSRCGCRLSRPDCEAVAEVLQSADLPWSDETVRTKLLPLLLEWDAQHPTCPVSAAFLPYPPTTGMPSLPLPPLPRPSIYNTHLLIALACEIYQKPSAHRLLILLSDDSHGAVGLAGAPVPPPAGDEGAAKQAGPLMALPAVLGAPGRRLPPGPPRASRTVPSTAAMTLWAVMGSPTATPAPLLSFLLYLQSVCSRAHA